MHIILGGTGHVGSAAARALLERGEAVTIVSRSRSKAPDLEARGARVAIADINDVKRVSRIVAQGTCLLLLNPPADPSTDVDAEERRTLAAIFAALDGAKLEKIVAISTYGAQPGKHIADLGALYEMEQELATLPIPGTIVRGAYYMSNWAAQVSSARKAGVIHTFFPADFKLPMVDPVDIGRTAAALMAGPGTSTGTYHVEGPYRYSANDVAAAFARVLERPVEAVEVAQEGWLEALEAVGFSRPAATAFANSFAATLKEPYPSSDVALHGTASLEEYVSALAAPMG